MIPACTSVGHACRWFWPTTSGIDVDPVGGGRSFAPLAVVVGGGFFVVVVGVVAVVVVACVVVVCVVVCFGGALATLRTTVAPFFSFAPAFGAWSTIVPGFASVVTVVFLGTRPWAFSSATASAYGRPVRSGSGLGGGGASTKIRTRLLRATSVPSFGRCDRTVPTGWRVCRCTIFGFRCASASTTS